MGLFRVLSRVDDGRITFVIDLSQVAARIGPAATICDTLDESMITVALGVGYTTHTVQP